MFKVLENFFESYSLSLEQMCWHFIEDTKAVVGKTAGALIQIKVIALHQLGYSSTSHAPKKKMQFHERAETYLGDKMVSIRNTFLLYPDGRQLFQGKAL